jgi:Ca2+/Na+ antiporter
MVPAHCSMDLFLDDLCLSLIDGGVFGLILEAIIFAFAFGGLAFAAEHLCNSMETLCERFRIHEDVGGATFIALGGAIPEITINCISTLKAVRAKSAEDAAISDLGVAAILGSGMIAFLVIPALSKVLSDQALTLRRRALYRDSIFYTLALCVLGSALYGGISIYHAPILVSIYICYVLILIFSDHIDFFWSRALGRPHLGPTYTCPETKEETATTPLLPIGGKFEISDSNSYHSIESSINLKEKSLVINFLSGMVSPLQAAIDFTCPDCRPGQPREDLYMVSFVVAMVWITAFSFLVTVIVERWVALLNMPGASALLGFVLVATGAEVPDSVNAVTMSRRGLGGMAISACLGSQVVNICLGLGMPWLIASLFGKRVPLSSDNDFVQEASLHVILAVATVVLIVNLLGPWSAPERSEITKWKAWILGICYLGSVGYLGYSTSSRKLLS